MYCTRCGKLNEDGARFCVGCGSPLAQADAQPGDQVAARPATPSPVGASPIVPAPATSAQQPAAPAARKTDRGILVALCAIGVVAIIGIGLFAANVLSPREQPTADSPAWGALGSSDVSPKQGSSSTGESEEDASSSDDPSADNDAEDSGKAAESTGEVNAKTPGDGAKVVPAAQTGADGYILPDVATHVYTREELSSLSQEDIRLASNEVLARHGRSFNTQSIKSYFESKSWYRAQYAPKDFDAMDGVLNDTEQANYDLLMSLRTDK